MSTVLPFRKPAKPPHIKKFYDISKKIEGAIATTDHHHRKAYLAGEEVLKDKDGVVHHDRLKDAKYQEKFADAMASTYLEAAKQYFRIDKKAKGDEVWKEQLMNAYANTTRSQLSELIKEHKATFTYDVFSQYQSKFMDELKARLEPVRHAHITDEHIDDILAHVGAKDMIDKSKITKKNAVKLLEYYRLNKALGKSGLRHANVPDYALKQAEYRSDYVEKNAA